MYKYITIFGLLFCVLGLQAQNAAASKKRLKSEDAQLYQRYERLLSKRPLHPLYMDSLSKLGEAPSLELMVKLAKIKARPQWGLAIVSEATAILPRKVTDGITTSVTGTLPEETVFEYSVGYNLGVDFQYFIFPKNEFPQPFLTDSTGNFQFEKHKAPKQFWSIHSGLRYQFDYYDYDQKVDLGLTDYVLHNLQFNHRLTIPISGRWNWNRIPKGPKEIEKINSNLPKIEKQSYYWGLGTEVRFLLYAERRYTYDNLTGSDRYINWSGANNQEVPYEKDLSDNLYRLQIAPFTEFGYRFRGYTEYKYPQYFSIALRYAYPFLTNMTAESLSDNQDNITDRAIYTIGDRDIIYHQNYGEITLSFSYEFQYYKIDTP